jgi:hypothetical protein
MRKDSEEGMWEGGDDGVCRRGDVRQGVRSMIL